MSTKSVDSASKEAKDHPSSVHPLWLTISHTHIRRLFLRELGIDFEDKRYAYDSTWGPLGKEFKQKGLSVTQKLPVLLIDGHTLTQHTAILRYLSRSVGAYDGTSNYDKWLVDAVSDVYVDWRVRDIPFLYYPFHSIPYPLTVLRTGQMGRSTH